MKKYIPSPADTADVKLPDALLPLIEEMARNVHEVWARNRINEGWSYGSWPTTTFPRARKTTTGPPPRRL